MRMNRKNADVAEELEWYFNHSAACIGIRSSWEATVNGAVFGSGVWEDPNTEFRMDSIRRLNRIERAFEKLTLIQKKCLYVVHSHERVHPYVQSMFGRLSGAVYVVCGRVGLSMDDLEKLCTKKQTGASLSLTEMTMFSRLRLEHQTVYGAALNNLATEWRKLKR